jgi:hypothetical protein
MGRQGEGVEEAFIEFMKTSAAQNWLALFAGLIALASYAVALMNYLDQKNRDRIVQLAENYLRLELESNEVFRFEAANAGALLKYKQSAMPADYKSDPLEETIADNYYLQQLNLFEIAARFRRAAAFDKAVFGSWVAWYYDVTTSWWFRRRWGESYADNYTNDLFMVFEPMTRRFEQEIGARALSEDGSDPRAASLKQAFYRHVSGVFGCKIVLEWLTRAEVAKSSVRGRRVLQPA